MSTLGRNSGCEADGGNGFRVGRCSITVSQDFDVIQLRNVLAKVGMRRQAVAATVDLGNSQCDALTRFGVDRPPLLGHC